MRYRLLLILLGLVLLTSPVFAQKINISGTVTDAATAQPLAGVSVVTDKKNATATRTDGTFSLSIDPASTVLIISHVGYTTQSITIGTQRNFNIALVVANNSMEDVVVIGYGTQRKSHLTGSVSKFKNEKLDESPVSRLDQALQGKIAGVQVQNLSSEAGSDPKVTVRGVSSINAGASPLVVVDGHPVPDGLAFINMADVESVEVLKDAASAAIYGSRGSSGVILITTRSGKSEKPKYNVKVSTGVKDAYELYPMMTSTEYLNMLYYEASLRAKDPNAPNVSISNNEKAQYVIENTLMGGVPTNWQDQAIRNAGVQNVQLNVSGGKKDVQYYLSGGYQNDQGMMYHSEYKKFNLRSKLDIQLSNRVKLSFNINPSYTKRERPSVNYIDFVRFYSYLPVYHTAATAAFVNQTPQWASILPGDFAQARHFNGRQYSGFMPDGSFFSSTGTVDPFSTNNNSPKSIMETRTINSNEYRVQGSGDLTVNILPGLDFKTMASEYVLYSNALDFRKRNSSADGQLNRGQYNNRLYIDLLSENTLTYNKQLRDHSINVLVGYTAQKTTIRDEQQVGQDYPNDNITTLNTAGQLLQFENGTLSTFNIKNENALLSALGRINYSYKNKYLISASYRTDGSSYFAPGHKWGSFPAISAGWVVTQEKFMDHLSWLNNLKLRGSYGVTGNNRVFDYYPYVPLLYAANYPLGSGNGGVSAGVIPSTTDPTTAVLANGDITWERTFQFNGGIDISLLRNAITLSIDAYSSKTDRLLLKQNTMAFTGFPQTWNNVGRLQNTGIEFEVTTNNMRKKDFRWTTSANLSHNKNQILELGGEAFFLNQGERSENYINQLGGPLVQFFGYKTDGVWLSQADIDAAKAAGLTSNLSNVFVPGGLKIVDVNGDKVIDTKDRIAIGSPYPDFTWGITNNFTYKAFDVSFTFQGVQGGELVNGDAFYNETRRINKNYTTNRWLSPLYPGDGKTPYFTSGFDWMLTDYVVQDASYYALREVIVGYTLPAKIAKSIKLNSTRLYFSAQNLYFHKASGYKGINPEARYTSSQYNTPLVDGYQRGSFPIPQTFLFGLDINF